MVSRQVILGTLSVVAGVLIAVLLLAILESGARLAGAFWLEPVREVKTYHNYEKYRVIDDFGLARPNAGYHTSYKQYRDNGEYLFRVTYHIDEFGRRVTPVAPGPGRDRYLLFAGGSFTYGAGVEGDETLPCQVGRRTRTYVPYNYGYHGWGPYDVLTKLRHYDLRSQIPQQRGLMIYLLISHHLNRVTGAMRIMKWKHNAPYYVLDENGHLVRKGTFSSGRPVLTFIYRLMARSELLRLLDVDLPVLNDTHHDLIVAAIAAIRAEYLAQFPDGEFYVAQLEDDAISARIVEQLQEKGVESFLVPSAYGRGRPMDPVYYLAEEDDHPSALTYEEMAEGIVAGLGLE